MLMWRNRWRNALIRRRLAVRFRPSTPAVVTLDVKRVVQETETKCDGKTVWGSGHADKAWPPSGPVVQKPVVEINNSHIQELHYMGIVFQFADGFSLMTLLDENADEVSENKSGD